MRLFRRKARPKTTLSGPPCAHCGSTNTGLVTHHGSDTPNFVRVWRGRRYLTYRCFTCGGDFYENEPAGGIDMGVDRDNRLVDDEEALRRAEEELKKETDESGDHRFG